ncbi:phosphocarrier protein HPr [Bacillus sp. HMF5848]|uniref:phosphocarrier protein HPr n=1 Tax=Bacillus sp. HMF5848 TaxID=2495421 RepID=UPI0021ADAD7E|nr:phosphocarrier protein HPr [Bacillus sp. HMF5848]
MIEKSFTVTSESGIHARPATNLVQAATQFDADVELVHKERTVNLKSIMGVLSLGITKGAVITIKVNGTDEEKAMSTIEDTIRKEGLGE